jgi:hypothetical protein
MCHITSKQPPSIFDDCFIIAFIIIFFYSIIFLFSLFRNKGWRRNLDAALQIVQLCLKLEIQLSDAENKKFLDLLLKRPQDKKRHEKKKITIEKYQFKF